MDTVPIDADASVRFRVDGVCEWSRRGVAQRSVVPWASFGPSPKNEIYDVPDLD